ncbi:MAG: hypothetical protein ACKVQC_08835 [Elusimicrobiota bacterium]
MLKKISSLILTLLYTFMQVVSAHAAETSLWAERKNHFQNKNSEAQTSPINLKNLTLPLFYNQRFINLGFAESHPVQTIPQDIVSIQEIHKGSQKNFVFLIQDIHQHTQAQEIIAKTIQTISKNSTQEIMIALEGAHGLFDFEPFRYLTTPEITKKIAKNFLNEKRISGAAYAGLTMEAPLPQFMGVDDPLLYSDHVKAVQDVEKNKKNFENQIIKSKIELTENFSQLNPHLQQLLTIKQEYMKGKLSLSAYINEFHTYSKVKIPAELNSFNRTAEIEKSLHFQTIENERKKAFDLLFSKLTEAESKTFIQKIWGFKEGKISSSQFYSDFFQLLRNKNIKKENYSALLQYTVYLENIDSLQISKVLEELDAYQTAVVEEYATTSFEHAYIREEKTVSLLEKLLNFSLTMNEWQQYKKEKNAPSFLIENKFSDVSLFEKFYELADKRSEKMAVNLLASSKTAQNAILVTGGFHTEEILNELKKQGSSYVILQPKISHVNEINGSDYLSVFTREKTPLDKLMMGDKLFLTNGAELIGSPNNMARPVSVLFRSIQIWILAQSHKGIFSRQGFVIRLLKTGIEITDQLFLSVLFLSKNPDKNSETVQTPEGILHVKAAPLTSEKTYEWAEKRGFSKRFAEVWVAFWKEAYDVFTANYLDKAHNHINDWQRTKRSWGLRLIWLSGFMGAALTAYLFSSALNNITQNKWFTYLALIAIAENILIASDLRARLIKDKNNIHKFIYYPMNFVFSLIALPAIIPGTIVHFFWNVIFKSAPLTSTPKFEITDKTRDIFKKSIGNEALFFLADFINDELMEIADSYYSGDTINQLDKALEKIKRISGKRKKFNEPGVNIGDNMRLIWEALRDAKYPIGDIILPRYSGTLDPLVQEWIDHYTHEEFLTPKLSPNFLATNKGKILSMMGLDFPKKQEDLEPKHQALFPEVVPETSTEVFDKKLKPLIKNGLENPKKESALFIYFGLGTALPLAETLLSIEKVTIIGISRENIWYLLQSIDYQYIQWGLTEEQRKTVLKRLTIEIKDPFGIIDAFTTNFKHEIVNFKKYLEEAGKKPQAKIVKEKIKKFYRTRFFELIKKLEDVSWELINSNQKFDYIISENTHFYFISLIKNIYSQTAGKTYPQNLQEDQNFIGTFLGPIALGKLTKLFQDHAHDETKIFFAEANGKIQIKPLTDNSGYEIGDHSTINDFLGLLYPLFTIFPLGIWPWPLDLEKLTKETSASLINGFIFKKIKAAPSDKEEVEKPIYKERQISREDKTMLISELKKYNLTLPEDIITALLKLPYAQISLEGVDLIAKTESGSLVVTNENALQILFALQKVDDERFKKDFYGLKIPRYMDNEGARISFHRWRAVQNHTTLIPTQRIIRLHELNRRKVIEKLLEIETSQVRELDELYDPLFLKDASFGDIEKQKKELRELAKQYFSNPIDKKVLFNIFDQDDSFALLEAVLKHKEVHIADWNDLVLREKTIPELVLQMKAIGLKPTEIKTLLKRLRFHIQDLSGFITEFSEKLSKIVEEGKANYDAAINSIASEPKEKSSAKNTYLGPKPRNMGEAAKFLFDQKAKSPKPLSQVSPEKTLELMRDKILDLIKEIKFSGWAPEGTEKFDLVIHSTYVTHVMEMMGKIIAFELIYDDTFSEELFDDYRPYIMSAIRKKLKNFIDIQMELFDKLMAKNGRSVIFDYNGRVTVFLDDNKFKIVKNPGTDEFFNGLKNNFNVEQVDEWPFIHTEVSNKTPANGLSATALFFSNKSIESPRIEIDAVKPENTEVKPVELEAAPLTPRAPKTPIQTSGGIINPLPRTSGKVKAITSGKPGTPLKPKSVGDTSPVAVNETIPEPDPDYVRIGNNSEPPFFIIEGPIPLIVDDGAIQVTGPLANTVTIMGPVVLGFTVADATLNESKPPTPKQVRQIPELFSPNTVDDQNLLLKIAIEIIPDFSDLIPGFDFSWVYSYADKLLQNVDLKSRESAEADIRDSLMGMLETAVTFLEFYPKGNLTEAISIHLQKLIEAWEKVIEAGKNGTEIIVDHYEITEQTLSSFTPDLPEIFINNFSEDDQNYLKHPRQNNLREPLENIYWNLKTREDDADDQEIFKVLKVFIQYRVESGMLSSDERVVYANEFLSFIAMNTDLSIDSILSIAQQYEEFLRSNFSDRKQIYPLAILESFRENLTPDPEKYLVQLEDENFTPPEETEEEIQKRIDRKDIEIMVLRKLIFFSALFKSEDETTKFTNDFVRFIQEIKEANNRDLTKPEIEFLADLTLQFMTHFLKHKEFSATSVPYYIFKKLKNIILTINETPNLETLKQETINKHFGEWEISILADIKTATDRANDLMSILKQATNSLPPEQQKRHMQAIVIKALAIINGGEEVISLENSDLDLELIQSAAQQMADYVKNNIEGQGDGTHTMPLEIFNRLFKNWSADDGKTDVKLPETTEELAPVAASPDKADEKATVDAATLPNTVATLPVVEQIIEPQGPAAPIQVQTETNPLPPFETGIIAKVNEAIDQVSPETELGFRDNFSQIMIQFLKPYADKIKMDLDFVVPLSLYLFEMGVSAENQGLPYILGVKRVLRITHEYFQTDSFTSNVERIKNTTDYLAGSFSNTFSPDIKQLLSRNSQTYLQKNDTPLVTINKFEELVDTLLQLVPPQDRNEFNKTRFINEITSLIRKTIAGEAAIPMTEEQINSLFNFVLWGIALMNNPPLPKVVEFIAILMPKLKLLPEINEDALEILIRTAIDETEIVCARILYLNTETRKALDSEEGKPYLNFFDLIGQIILSKTTTHIEDQDRIKFITSNLINIKVQNTLLRNNPEKMTLLLTEIIAALNANPNSKLNDIAVIVMTVSIKLASYWRDLSEITSFKSLIQEGIKEAIKYSESWELLKSPIKKNLFQINGTPVIMALLKFLKETYSHMPKNNTDKAKEGIRYLTVHIFDQFSSDKSTLQEVLEFLTTQLETNPRIGTKLFAEAAKKYITALATLLNDGKGFSQINSNDIWSGALSDADKELTTRRPKPGEDAPGSMFGLPRIDPMLELPFYSGISLSFILPWLAATLNLTENINVLLTLGFIGAILGFFVTKHIFGPLSLALHEKYGFKTLRDKYPQLRKFDLREQSKFIFKTLNKLTLLSLFIFVSVPLFLPQMSDWASILFPTFDGNVPQLFLGGVIRALILNFIVHERGNIKFIINQHVTEYRIEALRQKSPHRMILIPSSNLKKFAETVKHVSALLSAQTEKSQELMLLLTSEQKEWESDLQKLSLPQQITIVYQENISDKKLFENTLLTEVSGGRTFVTFILPPDPIISDEVALNISHYSADPVYSDNIRIKFLNVIKNALKNIRPGKLIDVIRQLTAGQTNA